MTVGRYLRKKICILLFKGMTPQEIKDANPNLSPSVKTNRTILKDFLRTNSFKTPRKKRTPGTRSKIQKSHRIFLFHYLMTADATLFLDEMKTLLRENFPHSPSYSIGLISATLLRFGFTRKKLEIYASQQSRWLYLRFKDSILNIADPSRLVFFDETRKDPRSLYRAYGYGECGKRLRAARAFRKHRNGYSACAFMTIDGIMGASFAGPGLKHDKCDTEWFLDFVLKKLIPHVKRTPGAVVICDNASIHHNEAFINLIEKDPISGDYTGARVLFLPPFCPQLNPIGM